MSSTQKPPYDAGNVAEPRLFTERHHLHRRRRSGRYVQPRRDRILFREVESLHHVPAVGPDLRITLLWWSLDTAGSRAVFRRLSGLPSQTFCGWQHDVFLVFRPAPGKTSEYCVSGRWNERAADGANLMCCLLQSTPTTAGTGRRRSPATALCILPQIETAGPHTSTDRDW